MSNHNEEKIVLKDEVGDEVDSPFYDLSRTAYINLCRKVTKRAEGYALLDATGDDWFDKQFTNSDHVRLGLGLRLIDMNTRWANKRNEYRNHEFNNYMIITNNTLVMQLKQYAANKRRNLARLLKTPNVDMMHAVILNTLVKLFDTECFDAISQEMVDAILSSCT